MTLTARSFAHAAAFSLMAIAGMAGASAPARAQALVATVNDSPITNVDVDQRMKLLRVLREPASRDAAIESLIADRLKLAETKKYGINPGSGDMAQEASRDATKHKMTPQQLEAGLKRAGVHPTHYEEHYRAQTAWTYLIGALNKSVNVSETEVAAELARRGTKSVAAEFGLRQITLVVQRSAGPGGYQARMHEAQSLRSRFANCETGIPLAQALRDVAVQPYTSRRSNALSPQLAKVLDSTPVGRLTPPQASPTGIEMIAVCSKKDSSGAGGSAGDVVRDDLLAKKLEGDSMRRYQELRKRAVIVRR